MCCKNLGQLVTSMRKDLGINSRKAFAEHVIGIDDKTLEGWVKDNAQNAQVTPQSQPRLENFKAFGRNPYWYTVSRIANFNRLEKEGERIPETAYVDRKAETFKGGMDVNDPDAIAINDAIKQHYKCWWDSAEIKKDSDPGNGINEESEKQPQPAQPLPMAHFSAVTLFAKLIRWKDRELYDAPFETKTMGMGNYKTEVAIYDEAVLYRHDTIASPTQGSVRIELISSGIFDVASIGHEQPALTFETYRNNDGRVAPLNFHVRPNQKEINYIVRSANGFQRGNENIAVKSFNDAYADELRIAVDFSSVVTSAQDFAEAPKAHYIPVDGSEREIQAYEVNDANLWYASYNNPELNSRLRMSWRLK